MGSATFTNVGLLHAAIITCPSCNFNWRAYTNDIYKAMNSEMFSVEAIIISVGPNGLRNELHIVFLTHINSVRCRIALKDLHKLGMNY